ncbi:MAG: helix-turn-helix domain-containing protein [Bacteroidales bacterium]
MYSIIREVAIFSPFVVSLNTALYLFIKGWKKDQAKLILCCFMLVGSIFYAINILKEIGNLAVYNYLHTVYIGLLTIGIPLIYFYICSLTRCKENSKYLKLHFIPAIFISGISTVLYFQMNYQTRIDFIQNISHPDKPFYLFLINFFIGFKLVFFAQLLFYFFRIRKILQKHKHTINQIFSDGSGFDLNWVNLFFKLLIVWGLFAIIGYSFLINSYMHLDRLSFLTNIAVSCLFAGLYIMASMQESLNNKINENKDLEFESETNYTAPNLKKKLLWCFEEKNIYLKKDLTIWDVCHETVSNRTYISNLINDEFGMNFNCFVNKYRVERATVILRSKDYNHKSLDEIARLSGFNSLASFNRAFKKFTNTYPGSLR